MGKLYNKVKEQQKKEIEKIIKDKQCTNCKMCSEHFNNVCVYDVEDIK